MVLINLAYCLDKPTGTTTYALNLLPYLQALDPLCLSPSTLSIPPDLRRYPVPTGMTAAQGLKGHLKRLAWTQGRLPQIYRVQGGKLLFCPIPEAPLGAALRTVVTVHDLIPLRFFRPLAPLRLYCQRVLPRVLAEAEHILCNSVTTANDLMQLLQVPADRITVIPLAYNADQFRWLQLPESNYFLCLGRCAPYKNWSRVIAAFAQLPSRTDYELWLVGPSDRRYQPHLQAQIQTLGLEAQIKWIDFLPPETLPQVLNQALALVFPSLWEGFGLPILEAMACGAPVITSNISAMPEVARTAAILVDPYDVGAIAEAMAQIGQTVQLRQQLRQAGFDQITQFSWQQTGEATRQVLEPLI